MIRKGRRYHKANHLTWRDWKPGDTEEDKSSGAYVVIVRMKDCLDDGEWCEEKYAAAPCIPVRAWLRTNCPVGKWRCQHRTKYYLVDGELRVANRYWTSTAYWVEDGQVYTSTLYRYTDPAQ